MEGEEWVGRKMGSKGVNVRGRVTGRKGVKQEGESDRKERS